MIFTIAFITVRVDFVKYLSRVDPRKINQEHFHQHFKLPEHNGMDDWRITLFDTG